MDAQLGRWKLEDEPAIACIDICETKNVSKERPRLLGIVGVDDGVRSCNHASEPIPPDRQPPVCGGAAGSCTATRSPPAPRGVRVRVPTCASVMLFTIARPRPTPAWSGRMRSVPRRKGSANQGHDIVVCLSPVYFAVSTILLFL